MEMYTFYHASNIQHYKAYTPLFDNIRKSKSKKVYCASNVLPKR